MGVPKMRKCIKCGSYRH